MPSEVVMLQSKDGLTKKFPLSASSVKLDYQNQVDLSTVTTDYTVPADGVVVTDSGEVTVNKGNIVRNTSSSFCVFIPYRHTIALPDETTAENIIAKDSTGANSTIQSVLDGKADSGYPSLLPEGYTRLESIESDGNQYIDTGVPSNTLGRIVTDWEWISLTPSDFYSYIFGAQTASSPWNTVYCRSQSNGITEISAQLVENFGYNYMTVGTPYNLDFTFLRGENNSEAILNGVSLGKKSSNNIPITDYNLFVFAVNNAGTAYRTSKIILKSMKLYNTSLELIRDFIPCKNASNIVGLYDTVNDVFYGNAGTGDFVAGQELPETDVPTLKDVADKVNALGTFELKETITPSGASANYFDGNLKIYINSIIRKVICCGAVTAKIQIPANYEGAIGFLVTDCIPFYEAQNVGNTRYNNTNYLFTTTKNIVNGAVAFENGSVAIPVGATINVDLEWFY